MAGRSRGLGGRGWAWALGAGLLALLGGVPAAQAQTGLIRLGGVYFNLATFLEAEYNDNINYSNENRESDIILRPGFQVGASYQVSQLNTLSLDLGMSLQQYLIHSSLSSFNSFASITPDSQLAYTIIVDNFTIKVYDAFSFSVQPNDVVIFNKTSNNFVYQISQYPRFTNQGGFNVDWNLNRVILYAGAYRYDVFPTTSEFNALARTQYTGLAGGRVIISPSVTAGLGVTYSANSFSQGFNNNSGSWYVGPTLVWQPNSSWTFNASGGYIFYSFQNTGTNGDTSQPSTLVGTASVTEQINSKMNHSVTISRTSSYGYVSNTVDVNRVGYQFQWLFRPRWTGNFWAYVEQGKDSGGLQPADYTKYGFSPGVEYQWNPNATIYANYEYTEQTSNIAAQAYNRDRILIGLRYQF